MLERAAARRAAALARVRAVADRVGAPGVVLTKPSSVAWAGADINPPIDRTAAVDTVWLAVSATDCTIITTHVELPRIVAELAPSDLRVIAVDWFDPNAFVEAAADVLAASPYGLASDGHPDFGVDVSDDLIAIRLDLSEAEQLDLADLAIDSTHAVESALRHWSPGETDFEIAARIAGDVEAVGADAPVLLVGGDDRLANFRHPVANGSRPQQTVMAVLVARRKGLHVALTRYVSTGQSSDAERALEVTQRIHGAVLDSVTNHTTFGNVMTALGDAYAAAGHPGEWRNHYQGGPIGFGQREFEIAPGQTTSRWWNEPVRPGVAVAFNPSLPGGAKDEDTYLVGANGELRWLTSSGHWPTTHVAGHARPSVLVHN